MDGQIIRFVNTKLYNSLITYLLERQEDISHKQFMLDSLKENDDPYLSLAYCISQLILNQFIFQAGYLVIHRVKLPPNMNTLDNSLYVLKKYLDTQTRRVINNPQTEVDIKWKEVTLNCIKASSFLSKFILPSS